MHTGPKGINWIEAFIYYCTPINGYLPSYQEVSKAFSVSLRTVEARAKKEEWVKARQELGKKQLETLAATREEEVLKADQRHLNLWRDILDTALKALEIHKSQSTNRIKDLKLIVEILKVAISGERTVLGLPNEVKRAEVSSQIMLETISPEEIEEIDHLIALNSLTQPPVDTINS